MESNIELIVGVMTLSVCGERTRIGFIIMNERRIWVNLVDQLADRCHRMLALNALNDCIE